MIQLHRDYLLLQTSSGDFIPCAPEIFSIKLIDNFGSNVDPDIVRHAAAAVLHYFKYDLKRQSISVGEFAQALEQALKAVGLKLSSATNAPADGIEIADLRTVARHTANGFELAFFRHLREELRARLASAPRVLRFQGLRGCVKEMLGAKRWNNRCQALNDQIVFYLRDCLETESPSTPCGLVVS